MKKYRFNPKKLVRNLFYLACISIFIWVFLSFLEILFHNMDSFTGNPYNYPDTNFFMVLINISKFWR